MEVRELLRQKYQNILNVTSELTQTVASMPSQINFSLKKRRETYQINIQSILQHISTAKSFIQQKQKQEQTIMKEFNEMKNWTSKRAKNINYELQRQRSLKLTLDILKVSKQKMKQYQKVYEEVKKSLTAPQLPQKLKINQYQTLIDSIKKQRTQQDNHKEIQLQNDKNVSKQLKRTALINQGQQNKSLLHRKSTKKQVSFIRSESFSKNKVTVDFRNQNLELKVPGRQSFKSLKNYQFSYNQEKEIFVPKNNQSKEAKEVLRNFNYHKNIKGLQEQLGKLS